MISEKAEYFSYFATLFWLVGVAFPFNQQNFERQLNIEIGFPPFEASCPLVGVDLCGFAEMFAEGLHLQSLRRSW